MDASATEDGARSLEERAPSSPRAATATGLLARGSIPIALVVAVAVFSLLRPETFPTQGNFDALVGTQATLLIVALAVTIVLAAGDFDLSVGAVVGLTMTVTAVLSVNHGWSWPLAALAALGAGAAVGGVNAFLVGVLGLNAFVSTLGTNTIVLGLTTGISGAQTVGPVPQGLSDVSSEKWLLGLPLVSLYGFVLVGILWYVLNHTPVGRYVFFVGGGIDVSRLAGLPVRAIKMGAFIAAAVLCALAGVLYAGQLGAADPTVGPSLLLPAYAAAFLGATTITPGRFNIWGTFFALYFVETCVTGLEQLGVPFWTESVFNGAILVIAIAFSRLASGKIRD